MKFSSGSERSVVKIFLSISASVLNWFQLSTNVWHFSTLIKSRSDEHVCSLLPTNFKSNCRVETSTRWIHKNVNKSTWSTQKMNVQVWPEGSHSMFFLRKGESPSYQNGLKRVHLCSPLVKRYIETGVWPVQADPDVSERGDTTSLNLTIFTTKMAPLEPKLLNIFFNYISVLTALKCSQWKMSCLM